MYIYTGCDQIPIELIQCLGEDGKQVIVDLVQKIYNDEELPPDFVNNIFIPLPKSSKAVRCEDHRTISLISHTYQEQNCTNHRTTAE